MRKAVDVYEPEAMTEGRGWFFGDASFPIARFGDQLVSVVEVTQANRFKLFCIECGHGFAAHLGKKRPWHFQHCPGAPANCPGRSLETKLHHATKHKLAAILRLRTTASIVPTCGFHIADVNGWPRPFPEEWDEVRVEAYTGTLRPDVSLWKGDTCVMAIEVLVSNMVSDKKAETLRADGLSWIEVNAKDFNDHLKERCGIDPFGTEVGPMAALPAVRVRLPGDNWSCPLCVASARLPPRRKQAEGTPTALEAIEMGTFIVDWQRQVRCATMSGDEVVLDQYIGRIEAEAPNPSLVGLYVTNAFLPAAERSTTAFDKYRDHVRNDFADAAKNVENELYALGATRVEPTPWEPMSDMGRRCSRAQSA